MNELYYGDNLAVLRKMDDASVDLIYLDPPFKSDAGYNKLFKAPDGKESLAQIEAFDDTWHWNQSAEDAFQDVRRSGNVAAMTMLQAMRSFLQDNDMMAYLAMMAVRMLELHRVLKPTGSLYLHCDPTASHYLKILLDAVFGPKNFRREVVWRSGWVSGFKTRTKNWVRNHDTIFYYHKDGSAEWTFNKIYKPHADDYERRGGGENKRGIAIDSVWNDPELYSPNIKSFSTEKLGYPTQKPQALLERIISASSNPGDTVLDPFCGCGTTVHAAQALGRRWIGIDITHLAIGLIEKRLRDAYRDEPGKLDFKTYGVPQDIEGARNLAQRGRKEGRHYFEFEKWAVSLLAGEQTKNTGDGGIDGIVPFGKKSMAVVSVKAGENVGVGMIRDLRGAMERTGAEIGIFLTLTPPKGGMAAEAAAAGQHEEPGFAPVPRIQIVTIEDAMALRDRAAQIPRAPRLGAEGRAEAEA